MGMCDMEGEQVGGITRADIIWMRDNAPRLEWERLQRERQPHLTAADHEQLVNIMEKRADISPQSTPDLDPREKRAQDDGVFYDQGYTPKLDKEKMTKEAIERLEDQDACTRLTKDAQ